MKRFSRHIKREDKVKNPAIYRLDFIHENTFNRVWSVRMTTLRVALVSAAVAAGGAALVWCVMAYTPMRRLLPGALTHDLRAQYVEVALKLDSLEQAARANDAYMANLLNIMRGEVAIEPAAAVEVPEARIDSLLAASEAEKAFVRRYEDEERFNLSVLAPLAAEGMVFTSPMPVPGVAAAAYRGTVVGVTVGTDGLSTVTVQHPNDFISMYSGLRDVYVDKGRKVIGGQRIGSAPVRQAPGFELWHGGSELDPEDYISF